MKKLLPFVAAVAMLGAVSCKKEYTCDCTTTDSADATYSGSVSYTFTETKSNAEDLCTASESSLGTLTTTCTLN